MEKLICIVNLTNNIGLGHKKLSQVRIVTVKRKNRRTMYEKNWSRVKNHFHYNIFFIELKFKSV